MFSGVLVAIVTPFTDGRIDEEAFRGLINQQLALGINGVVPCGTTGESATMSHEEHKRVVEICVDEVRGRVPVIAGTGSNNTAEAIDMTLHAKKAGADGALMITPYYNKPTQEGVYRHFKAVYEAAPMPIILYNIPGRTASNVAPETIARLAKEKYIVGVKEATGDLNQMARTIDLCGPDVDVLSGDDSLTLPLLSVGGRGVISVACHIVGAEMIEMYNAFMAGDNKRARELHYRILPIMRTLFVETNPIPLKTALSWLGVCKPDVRLPLCPMAPENEAKLRKVLTDYGLLK